MPEPMSQSELDAKARKWTALQSRRFGDERLDYALALDTHYGRADDGSWRDDHASFYASSHPWEDFAESWAQLMHVHDVVETGSAWGVVQAPEDRGDPVAWLATSITASVAANELARAMGMRDLYPFGHLPPAKGRKRSGRADRPLPC